MSTPTASDVAFIKSVLGLLEAYGQPLTARTIEYANADLLDYYNANELWASITADIGHFLIKSYREQSTAKALRFFHEVTKLATKETLAYYIGLMYEMRDEHNIFLLFLYAETEDDAYTFSMMFMTLIPDYNTREVASLVAEKLLGKPFHLGDAQDNWLHEYTLAMFGPLWQSLYLDELGDYTNFLDIVFCQRPLITGRTRVVPPLPGALPAAFD